MKPRLDGLDGLDTLRALAITLVLALYALFPAFMRGGPLPPLWKFLTFTQKF